MKSRFEIFAQPNRHYHIAVNNNKPVPILRIDATGLDTRVSQQILEVMVFDGEKVGKFFIDLSISDQHRPRIRVACNHPRERRTISKDLLGRFRDPSNPTEKMPE